MTDKQQPNDGSSSSSDGTDADLVSEGQIDDALAEASSLASTLSEEVGAAEQDAPRAEDHPNKDGPSDTALDLDAELRELEKLVTDTGNELDAAPGGPGRHLPPVDDGQEHAQQAPPGTASGASSRDHPETVDPGAPLSQTGKSPSSELSVPDFMAEFTEPAEPDSPGTGEQAAPSEPATEDDSSASDDLPDFMSELTQPSDPGLDAPDPPSAVPDTDTERSDFGQSDCLAPAPDRSENGLQGASIDPSAHEDWQGLDGAVPAQDPMAELSDSATTAKFKKLAHLLGLRLSPTVAAACDKVVTLLEVADRPMGRVGRRTRYIIGWLAVATVGTSIVVYILSLF
jgi:hypothetical protein